MTPPTHTPVQRPRTHGLGWCPDRVGPAGFPAAALCRATHLKLTVRGSPVVPEEPDPQGVQVLRLVDHAALEPGITCIVGPNGSGKSNVVDALAWVMGEQGASRCAAARWRTSSSPAPPAARRWAAPRSSLTIDNTRRRAADRLRRGHDQPDDVPQRRLGVRHQRPPCRLLDVQELLSDSGIGREMHVIVGQGQLDSILHATPEDRRGFIEEAAGVLKHRKRKEKALRKLDAMQGNLTRVSDLTAEMRASSSRWAARPRSPAGPPASRPTCATPGPGCSPTTWSPRGRRSSRRSPTRRRCVARRRRSRPLARGPRARRPPSRPRCARTCRPGAGPGDLVRAVRPAGAGHAAPSRWPPSGSATPPGRESEPSSRAATPRARARGRQVREQEQRIGDEVEPTGRARAGGRRRRRGRGRRRRGGAPGRRPRPRRRRPARGAGPAARPGQRRRTQPPPRPTTRSAGCAPARRGGRRPRRARPARVHRARDPGRRPRRRRGGASTPSTRRRRRPRRPRGPAGQGPRRGPARRPRPVALTARKEALEMGLRKDGAGALLAASDRRRRGARLGGRAAQRPRRLRDRGGRRPRRAADAVAVVDVGRRRRAIDLLKDDDLGRAGLVVGGRARAPTSAAGRGPALPAEAAYAVDLVTAPTPCARR